MVGSAVVGRGGSVAVALGSGRRWSVSARLVGGSVGRYPRRTYRGMQSGARQDTGSLVRELQFRIFDSGIGFRESNFRNPVSRFCFPEPCRTCRPTHSLTSPDAHTLAERTHNEHRTRFHRLHRRGLRPDHNGRPVDYAKAATAMTAQTTQTPLRRLRRAVALSVSFRT